jgi:DNA polymerase-3 subunit gamma/tau
MVYYRKYRPQKISELDLAEVRAKFTHLLTSSDIPHAFLFTGPKGLGKTSSARILAKAINCKQRVASSRVQVDKEEKKTKSHELSAISQIEPCNSCDICTSITNGSHVDVVEIDAASNRGIDEIRDLRERVKYAPAELKKKVYIIDEVHMLTTEAFNALLKTLEEPPSHVLFILCTTEEWKIPTTVASRTFHVRFEKPSKEELLRSLQRIVDGENLIIEKSILEKIFDLSDGAFRNAAKNLEELSVYSENKEITAQTLESVFKIGSTEKMIEELLNAIQNKKLSSSLQIIQIFADNGIDFKVVHEKLVQHLHQELITLQIDNKYISDFSLAEIKKLLEVINISYGQLRFSVLPQLPLEIAIMDYFMVTLPVDEKSTTIEVNHKEVETVIAQPVTETVQTPPPKRGRPDMWARLIDSVKQDNHSVAGILRGCQLGSVENDVITIESKFTFHGERLMEKETKALLEKHATEVSGKPTKVEIKIIN